MISSDEVVHRLYERADIVALVRERFGAGVIRDGVVDRTALARVVFADPAQLAWLENLLHPFVRRAIAEWIAAQQQAEPRPLLLVAEVPLLFEGGFADDFDYVLVITAPAPVRRRRLSARFSAADLERRLAQQLPEEDKVARADFVFTNTGDRRQLRAFLGETVAAILAATVAATTPAT